jgi:hypothetical protein
MSSENEITSKYILIEKAKRIYDSKINELVKDVTQMVKPWFNHIFEFTFF